jgi:O-antigen ligase
MHSNIIQLLVDTGILGLISWLSIWATYFFTIFKKLNSYDNINSKGLALGATAATLGFLTGGMFETNFYDSEVVMLLYFLMGISLTQNKQNSLKPS